MKKLTLTMTLLLLTGLAAKADRIIVLKDIHLSAGVPYALVGDCVLQLREAPWTDKISKYTTLNITAEKASMGSVDLHRDQGYVRIFKVQHKLIQSVNCERTRRDSPMNLGIIKETSDGALDAVFN